MYNQPITQTEVLLLPLDLLRPFFQKKMIPHGFSTQRLNKIHACHYEADQLRSYGAGIAACLLLQNHGMDLHDLTESATGKPLIQNQRGFISLSHDGDYALAAISAKDIGADIEQHDEKLLYIADHYYSAEEQAYLRNLSGEDKIYAFFTLWSAKEAMIKRDGATSLRKISYFHPTPGCIFQTYPVEGYSCVIECDQSLPVSFTRAQSSHLDQLTWIPSPVN